MATMLEPRPKVYWIVSDISDKNAGYRLRIYPICQKLIAFGVNLEIITEQQLAQEISAIVEQANTVISSKPGNTRVYLCLKYLKQNNVKIIIDLFDNYFSWSPLVHHYGVYWNWLRVLDLASEVMVSTSFLKNTLEHLSKTNIRLVTDPLPVLPNYESSSDNRLFNKWQHPERLELLWFGINNNPYYSAGLDDLLSWVSVVEEIVTRLGCKLDIALTVCTKAVADVEIVLHVFNRHGISTRFIEWSEEVCDNLLKDSHVVLLPTKLNGFSLSKTHNRCSDALASGCLVLSNPNSPYREYNNGVFYSVSQLCDVLLSSNQAVIENLISSGLQRINDLANFDNLVNQFGLALTSPVATSDTQISMGTRPVLIASHTGMETIKLSRTLGYFIASFKGSGIKANFDIYLESFDVESLTVKLVLTDKAYNYFISSIIGSFDLEWSGTKDNLVCINDAWRFVFARSSLTCAIKLHNTDDSLLKLSAISKMSHFHSDHLDLWFAEHVKLLCKALRLLNVTEIEIAGDDHHGWQDYASVCSPALVEEKNLLNGLWHDYLGHELDLGRFVNKESSLC